MKEVDHPNVIRIHEVFFGTRTVYLIMELCSGGELFAHLTTHYKKGFVEAHAALLMRDMLSSVRYLHTKGIVHRDIKLENFLFEVNTTDSRLKLIDFGLSKHCNENEQMHQVVGSAYYTAPEVLEGHYDHRCDIWSLGIVAYMLLCGAPPFYGDSSDQIHEMIKTREAQFPAKRLGHVSENGINFLKSMLVKDPEKRISMEDALNHPFILSANTYCISEESAVLTRRKSMIGPPSVDVVSSLESFIKSNVAKKLVMNSVAFALTPKQIAELIDEFNSIDVDRNGVITMDELTKAISSVNSNSSAAVVNHLIPSLEAMGISTDSKLEINYSEFIAAAMCKRVEIDDERIQVAFEAVDETGTGYLDKDAIKRILGADASDADVEAVMKEIDYDSDGKIDYREFAKYWKTLQLSLTPKKRVVAAVTNVSRSLKVISRLAVGSMSVAKMPMPVLNEDSDYNPNANVSSTPTLPMIGTASVSNNNSSVTSISKRLMGGGSSSSSNANNNSPTKGGDVSPRTKAAQLAAQNTANAIAPPVQSNGIIGGLSNMFMTMGGMVGVTNSAVNADDPQSLGRKQWTQLRVQKVCYLDVFYCLL